MHISAPIITIEQFKDSEDHQRSLYGSTLSYQERQAMSKRIDHVLGAPLPARQLRMSIAEISSIQRRWDCAFSECERTKRPYCSL